MEFEDQNLLPDGLTETEVRVIILSLYCNARKDIADILGNRLNTINTHVKTIYNKLKLKGQLDLFRYGLKRNLYNKGYVGNRYMFDGYQNLPWEDDEAAA